MSKKKILTIFLLGAVITLIVWTLQNTRKKSIFENAKNIIIIGIDTCRADHLSSYGYTIDTSPHLRSLQKDSVIFTKAFSHSPWTLPSFASLLTSTYPTVHGARGKAVENRFQSIRTNLQSGVEIFSQRGFKTKAFANCPYLAPEFGFARGFDNFDYAHGNNSRIRKADETIERAIEWIEQNSEEKTFLFIHLFDPHMDYDPPQGHIDRLRRLSGFEYTGSLRAPFSLLPEVKKGEIRLSEDDWRFIQLLYDAELSFVDENCGKLFTYLRNKKIYDRTAIVVLSDHGEEFLDHGGFEHGHSQYDELLHVPLLVKMPFDYMAGTSISSQVGLIDIMPTLFEMLSIKIPREFQGRSLLKLIEKGKEKTERAVYSEETHWGDELKAIRHDGYKLIVGPLFESRELYGLSTDPLEKNNLLDTGKGKANKMKEKFASWVRRNLEIVKKYPEENLTDLDKQTIENLKSLGYIK